MGRIVVLFPRQGFKARFLAFQIDLGPVVAVRIIGDPHGQRLAGANPQAQEANKKDFMHADDATVGVCAGQSTRPPGAGGIFLGTALDTWSAYANRRRRQFGTGCGPARLLFPELDGK